MSLTCNAFGARTANNFRNAMQAASCEKALPFPNYPQPPDNFRAALLDSLYVLAQNKGLNLPAYGQIPQCDLLAVKYNLNCAIQGAQLDFPDLDEDTFQGIVLYMLNALLCAS